MDSSFKVVLIVLIPLIPGRLHALQTGLSIKKDKEDLTFLFALMDWLEKTKQEMKSNEVNCSDIDFYVLLKGLFTYRLSRMKLLLKLTWKM